MIKLGRNDCYVYGEKKTLKAIMSHCDEVIKGNIFNSSEISRIYRCQIKKENYEQIQRALAASTLKKFHKPRYDQDSYRHD
jgi:hypothetical protein